MLFESTVKKVFIDAYVIFGNGHILAKKGSLNIALLAQYYKKCVIACCGSWMFCGDCPVSDIELEDIYGEQILDDYDLIEGKTLDHVVLEFGPIIPTQVKYHVSEGYKGCGLENINW